MTIPLAVPPPTALGEPSLQAAAPTDAELVARARRGDGLAFELIMRRNNRRLFRLARSLLGRDAEAEDVLQEAYVRAYTRLGDLADGQALAAWLARIVANEALGRLRAAARVISLEEYRAPVDEEDDATLADKLAADALDPERLAGSGELRRLLETAVDGLPEEFRSVFVLREVEGLSTAETATFLAIRVETVKSRLHRARRLLQERLSEHLLPLSPSLFEFGGGRCDRVVSRVLARLDEPAAGAASALPAFPAAAAACPGVRARWLARLFALFTPRRK